MTHCATRNLFVELETVSCYQCGILFAVEASVRQRWQREGGVFYCPNGHRQGYVETDVQRLTKQLEAAKQEVAEATKRELFAKYNATAERAAREQTERQLRARKGINTRLRNRIRCGVCPCCRRNFENLSRHMKTKHPHFAADDREK